MTGKKIGRSLAVYLLVLALLCIQTGCGFGGGDKEDGTQSDNSADEEAAAGRERDAEDTDNTESDGSQVAGKGRYMETLTPLPDKEGYLGRSMAMLSDGSLAFFSAYDGLFVSSDGGASWVQRRSTEELLNGQFDKIPYMGNTSIAPDGSVGMVCSEFQEGKDTKVTLVTADAEGNNLSIPGNMEDGDYLHKVFWRNEKELYGVSVKGRILLADQETGGLKELFTSSDMVETVAFTDSKMLLLENAGVEIYNLEEKRLEEPDAVLDEFCKERFRGMLCTTDSMVGILLAEGEDIVYVVCGDGVFRHVLGGTAMEEFVDGRFCSLNDTRLGLCGFLALEDGDFLLLTTGEELVRLSYDPDEPTMPEQQLKVYSLYETDRIRQAISAYQKENPEVWVDYQVGIAENSAVTLTDALKNLNMELLGGNGPDVLVMDGMDEEVYREKGVLADLTDILASFTGEKEILPSILAGCTREGGCYAFPAAFALPLVCTRSETEGTIETLSDLADAVEALEQEGKGSVTGQFTAQQELAQLLSLGGEGILQGKELDREALKEFLTQAKRIYTVSQRVVSPDYRESFGKRSGAVSFGQVAEMVGMDVAQICYGMAESMVFDIGVLSVLLESGAYQVNLYGDGGFLPVCSMAITANAAQPKLAEEFFRTVFSKELQEAEYQGFPVNRAAFEKMCSDQENQVSFGGTTFLPDGTERYFSAEYPSRQTTMRLEELVEETGYGMWKNAFLEEAVMTYGPDVLAGMMDIEEGVDAVAKAVAIYLAE